MNPVPRNPGDPSEMPDPDRLLTTLQRAVDAFRATPGRRGRLVALRRGRRSPRRRRPARQRRQLPPPAPEGRPRPQPGPASRPAGSRPRPAPLPGRRRPVAPAARPVAALKCQHPRQVHFLIGNHELAQAAGRRIAKDDVELNDLFIQGVRDGLRRPRRRSVRRLPAADRRRPAGAADAEPRLPQPQPAAGVAPGGVRPRRAGARRVHRGRLHARRRRPRPRLGPRHARRRRRPRSCKRWTPTCSSRATSPATPASRPPTTAS